MACKNLSDDDTFLSPKFAQIIEQVVVLHCSVVPLVQEGRTAEVWAWQLEPPWCENDIKICVWNRTSAK